MRFGLGTPASDDEDPVVPLPRLYPRRRSSPSTPVTSSPFKLPDLSTRSHRRRRSLVAPSHSDDSASSSAESASSSEDSDSEEEQWPVGPRGSVGLGGKSDRNKGKTKLGAPTRTVVPAPVVDHFDTWHDHARREAWAAANASFRLSLARSSSSSSCRPRSARPDPRPDPASDDELGSLLSRLALEQERETRQLVEAFERRNKSLWDAIEGSIALAERAERELEAKRVKELEQERRAREMRDRELKRQQAELARAEQLKRDAEEAEQAERDRVERERHELELKQQELDKKNVAIRGASTGEGSPKGEFEKWTAKMTHIKQTVLPTVSQNPTLRKACFQAKRSITPKIGQLTSSLSAIARIISQLDDVLRSVRESTQSHDAYVWTLNHLSKSVIKQAETEVTAKLGTAYPLGRVVVGLLLRGHTEFGDVLMARLVKKCFWITGYWPSKQPGQTEESYRKTLGYASAASPESSVQYGERMAGLVALYAAILDASPLAPPQSVPSVSSASTSRETLARVPAWFRPSAGWRFLVLVLRQPLASLEPVPLVVLQFVAVAHATLAQTYGRQFEKLLAVVLREGIREDKAGFDKTKARASIVRLELWLEEWEHSAGRVKPVEGRECDE
ncbi:hypothetical protein JCM11491_000584 [Sporobolomyces phaffii]